MMNELKDFALGSLGILGDMEAVDTQILSPQEADLQTLIIRFVITLLAGILSAVISKWVKSSISKAALNNEMTTSAQKNPKLKKC